MGRRCEGLGLPPGLPDSDRLVRFDSPRISENKPNNEIVFNGDRHGLNGGFFARGRSDSLPRGIQFDLIVGRAGGTMNMITGLLLSPSG